MKNELVILWNNQPVTTSHKIAADFGKLHKDVMRDIRNLIGQLDNERKIAPVKMFDESTYLDKKGEQRPMYYINRDGFTLLAMGFTGKKALEFKLKYIAAFNAMEQTLKNIGALSSTDDKLTVKEKIDYLLKFTQISPSNEQKINLINQSAKLLGVDVPNCSTETFGTSETRRKYKRKLSDEQIRDIKQTYSQGNISLRKIAEMYNVGIGTVHRALNQGLKDDEFPF